MSWKEFTRESTIILDEGNRRRRDKVREQEMRKKKLKSKLKAKTNYLGNIKKKKVVKVNDV